MEKNNQIDRSSDADITNGEDEILLPVGKKRPLGLSVLLIFSFVYVGLLLLIFIAGLFFPDVVQNILQQYYKQTYISGSFSIIINVISVLVLGISFYGLILLWHYKKRGFYYYGISQLIILATVVFFLRSYDWINITVALLILAIIGMSSRKMD